MNKPPFLKYINSEWVNLQWSNMTLKEKVGQLFQVAAFSYKGKEEEQRLIELIEQHHLGGLTFFQGNPTSQAILTNKLQEKSKVPLFINIDAEWGLAMRLENTIQYPYQMALGAIEDNNLLYQTAQKIAKQCKRLGIHSALAPVVDVNNNPNNPVINYRSFGENKKKVTEKGLAIMKGLQDAHTLDCAKHFPGHGNTATDSHLSLPTLLQSDEELRNIELYPFKKLIEEGVSSIMVAHLHIPAWDKQKNMPVTLSQKIIQGILRNELGFEGLIITDAMDMQGITTHYPSGQADKMAILAGCDIITNSVNIPDGVNAICKALETGELAEEALEKKVRRILAMKQWVGLNKYIPIQVTHLLEDLNLSNDNKWNETLAEKSITLLKNKDNILPITYKTQQDTAFLHIQITKKTLAKRDNVAHHLKNINKNDQVSYFINQIKSNFPNAYHSHWQQGNNSSSLEEALNAIKHKKLIISIHGVNIKPLNNFDIPQEVLEEIGKTTDTHEVVLMLFGNPYSLSLFKQLDKVKGLIVTYQEGYFFYKKVAEMLFSLTEISGRLPVSIHPYFKEGDGV